MDRLIQGRHAPPALFIFYKNLVYENIKASKCPKIKNVVVFFICSYLYDVLIKQGWIHGDPSRVRVGRGQI